MPTTRKEEANAALGEFRRRRWGDVRNRMQRGDDRLFLIGDQLECRHANRQFRRKAMTNHGPQGRSRAATVVIVQLHIAWGPGSLLRVAARLLGSTFAGGLGTAGLRGLCECLRSVNRNEHFVLGCPSQLLCLTQATARLPAGVSVAAAAGMVLAREGDRRVFFDTGNNRHTYQSQRHSPKK